MIVDLNETDTGAVLHLRIGDVLRISLPENPTTGFRWKADPALPGQFVTLRDENAGSAAVGAGGRRLLELRASQKGVFEVHLWHRKEWQGSPAPIGVFRVTGAVR